ncbi:Peptidase family M23 [Methylobacterium phyllostachyos]|uniref:Peptidase family M23 n=1 Tax=Methylobacterium phyllostachyos TaxID=582672 RepID=A0A1H0BJJ2_9HYPH|nr:M23 family metallopeptidase [Methylobacterium phyllostachyos]SDN45797.1 Peptidase family M23 [Methylobacterium phyllostachyos]
MPVSKISSRLPPRATPWLAAGLALALLWALGATYLIVFHDEVLAGFVARQAALRDAYEAQLAELRDHIDRDRRDQAGTETGLADRVAAALERQAELERRAAALAELTRQTLPDPIATGALAPRPGPNRAPVDDEPDLRTDDEAESARTLPRRSALDVETGLIRLEARLEGLQAAQGERLAGLAARAGDEVRRLHGLIRRTGLDPARFDAPSAGVGGPLVPLDSRVLDGAGFEASLALARRTLADGERLRRTTAGLPLGRPIRGAATVSSPFGTRLDPFTRGLALHTGLDLKADYGEPARATAPGRVIAAEAAGGYGNMVEIDHGHGLTTRFGHLARIAVYPGQRVAAGDTIGSVGSTGRSTGAHLHYETRIDGVPVDPQRFLIAGATRAQQYAD